MNWDQIGVEWEWWAARAKERWAGLTDGGLRAVAGRRDPLAALLRSRYGYTPREVENELDGFSFMSPTTRPG